MQMLASGIDATTNFALAASCQYGIETCLPPRGHEHQATRQGLHLAPEKNPGTLQTAGQPTKQAHDIGARVHRSNGIKAALPVRRMVIVACPHAVDDIRHVSGRGRMNRSPAGSSR